MRIAIDYSYEFFCPGTKEGIGRFTSMLVDSLLQINPRIEVEIWSLSVNRHCVAELFTSSVTNYSDRIFFYDEDGVYDVASLPESSSFESVVVSKEPLLERLNKKKFFCTVKNFVKMISPRFVRGVGNMLKKCNKTQGEAGDPLIPLAASLHANTKADIFFVIAPRLRLGTFFEGIKVVQIHDLFTFQFISLFNKIEDISSYNKKIAKIIFEYAAKDGLFVASTSYTVEKHIRKYFPSIKKTSVIPFPPLIKGVSTLEIASEKDFRNKYHIDCQYIPFACQNRANKNLIQLLKALVILKKGGLNIKILATSFLHHNPLTKNFVEENDLIEDVLEIGEISVEDLFALYKYAAVVVVPTYIEGYGMSAQCLEALATHSTPVVHVKSYGIKESLQSVGLSYETADLAWVELGDFKGMAEKISIVLNDRQKYIKEQQHILSHYLSITWEDVAKNYLEIFQSYKSNKSEL